MSTAAIVAGIVMCGLIAGLFWGWMIAVGPGLADVSDHAYMSTMQSVNVAIVNPIFLAVFGGSGITLGTAAVFALRDDNAVRALWLGAAAASYLIGVFGVTVAGNVPLNDRLASVDRSGADAAALREARIAYEGPWNRLHRIRSVVNIAALTMAAIGAVV